MNEEELKQRLLALNDPWKCVAFAARMALLALPTLAINPEDIEKPFLYFWKEKSRKRNLLTILRAGQLAWCPVCVEKFRDNQMWKVYASHISHLTPSSNIPAPEVAIIACDAVSAALAAANPNIESTVYFTASVLNSSSIINIDIVLSNLSFLEKNELSTFLQQPVEIISPDLHMRFMQGLKELGDGFDTYWLNWYQDRIAGKPLNPDTVEAQILLEPKYNINNALPAEINARLLYQWQQYEQKNHLIFKKIILNNIGRFENIEIPLAPTEENCSNITAIVGNNGAGKTSILKSFAIALSWFIARLRTEKGNGSPISEETILNKANEAKITVETTEGLQWTIAKTRRGRKANYNSQLVDVTALAEFYRNALSNNDKQNFPLIVFYPVERTVLEISLKITKEKNKFSQLDGYEDALNQGINFQRFFEWFREREDSENEIGLSDDVFTLLEKEANIKPDSEIWQQLIRLKSTNKDRQLTAVRTAITRFMPDFSNLKVRRKPRLYMSIDKQGETLNVAQLSQGEKSLMALVGDIARRLAMMNPSLENPLEGQGIVLIDEVDMHLHPQWQRNLIKQLTTTFPNCQFLLTTHSPLVISDSKDVLVYVLDDGELRKLPPLYGEDANSVLLSVMNTYIRNAAVNQQLGDLLDAIQDAEFERARSLLTELEKDLASDNLELVKAKLLLRKQELRHEKNQ